VKHRDQDITSTNILILFQNFVVFVENIRMTNLLCVCLDLMLYIEGSCTKQHNLIPQYHLSHYCFSLLLSHLCNLHFIIVLAFFDFSKIIVVL
jgi:hypothetical protein